MFSLNQLCSKQVQQRSAGRRKTWAESSVFHGGVATSYAGGVAGALSHEHHDHSCPAANLYTKVNLCYAHYGSMTEPWWPSGLACQSNARSMLDIEGSNNQGLAVSFSSRNAQLNTGSSIRMN